MTVAAGLLVVSVVLGVAISRSDSSMVRTMQHFVRTIGVISRLVIAAAFARAALHVIASRANRTRSRS